MAHRTFNCRRFCVSVLSLFCVAHAFNHPEIRWQSVATEHFIIHYYDRTEPAVYAAWKIAEEAYDALAPLYRYPFVEKINITLADYDDYSNGWAAWTERTIGIWLPDLSFELRGNTTWLRNVLTHEIAHIMSMEKKKGMQLPAWSFLLDYESPSLGLTLTEPVPFMTFVPAWFAEGTAQAGAERLGADCWDSRRDMALRCAFAGGAELSLDEMGHFTHDWIGSELVYAQGYSFVKYLEKRFGEQACASLWTEARDRRVFGRSFDAMVSEKTGARLRDLYSQWHDSLAARYKETALPFSTATSALWARGTYNARPRMSRDGKYAGFLTNDRDDGLRTDLVILDRSDSRIAARIPYARGSWDFSPDGNRLFFIKARRPDSCGSFFNSLYMYEPASGRAVVLEPSSRIYELACSPDGNELCCVLFRNGAFHLELYYPVTHRFETIVDGVAGEPILHVCYSPFSPDTVVISRVIDGQADLFMVDVRAKTVAPLAAAPAQEESPHWGSDNRIYYSADYDGVFNVYSVAPDGSGLTRHSSVAGGVFFPGLVPDGNMVAAEYTPAGFRIATFTPSREPFSPPEKARCMFRPLPAPRGKVTINSKPYEARLLRPVWAMSSLAIVNDSADVLAKAVRGRYDGDVISDIRPSAATSLVLSRSDALGKKTMYMGLAGAVDVLVVPEDTGSSAQYSRYNRPAMPDTREVSARAGPAQQRISRRQGRAMLLPETEKFLRRYPGAAAGADTVAAGQDSVIFWNASLIPMLGVMNAARRPTLGVDMQAVLVMMLPYALVVNPYAELRLGRDVYCGVSPFLSVWLFDLVLGSTHAADISVPFWVSWQTGDYYNQDIAYNLAGVTALNAVIEPRISPLIMITSAAEGSSHADTSVVNEPSLFSSVQLLHGFPVRRYASLKVNGNASFFLLRDALPDGRGRLDGESVLYAQSGAGARFVFPVLRDINRGRYYADNLYGSVSYDFSLYINDNFLGSPTGMVLVDPRAADGSASVTHMLAAGAELGFVKKYFFERLLSLGVSYELVEKEAGAWLRIIF